MNIFNRTIMTIFMFFLMIFAVVSMINVFTGLFEWSSITDRIAGSLIKQNPFILMLMFSSVFFIALILLILELSRRKTKVNKTSSDQSANTRLILLRTDIKTMTSLITRKLADLKGVIDPKVNIVLPAHGGIIINTESKLEKGININSKVKEIKKTTSDFAAKKLGFKVIESNYTACGFMNTEIQNVMNYYNIENRTEIDTDKKIREYV